MNLLDRAAAWWTERRNISVSIGNSDKFWETFSPWWGEKTDAGVSVSDEKILGLPAAHRAIAILASSSAVLPLKVYRNRRSGTRQEVPDHRVAEFFRRPYPDHPGIIWRENQAAHVAGWGNALSIPTRYAQGVPVEAIPLHPRDFVKHERNSSGELIYHCRIGNSVFPIPRSQILHVPLMSLNGEMGLSPMTKFMQAHGITLATQEFGAKFFGNGANPRGVIQMPHKLNEQDQIAIAKAFSKTYSGMDNAMKTAVLHNGAEYKAITMAPEEAQFLETRRFQTSEIANIYGVPPHLLAQLDRATHSNIEQQHIEFVQFSLLHFVRRFEAEWNYTLFTARERGSYYVEHCLEGLLRGDSAARAAFYQGMFNLGAMSPNDIAAKENLPPSDGGDQRFVPLNMVPLQKVESVFDDGNDSIPDDGGDPADDSEASGAGRSVAAVRVPEVRQVALTAQLRDSFRRLFEEAALRALRRELTDVHRQVKKIEPGDVTEFLEFLDTYYDEFRSTVVDFWMPALTAYGESVHRSAADQIGADVDFAEIEEEIRKHADVLAQSYTLSHHQQLRQVALDSEFEGEREALEGRLSGWEETEAKKWGMREIVEAMSVVSVATWAIAGVTKLRWVRVGSETCPFCTRMDGRVVGITQHFVAKGETVESGSEKTKDLTVRRPIRWPPLHRGCDCQIRAELGL